MMTVAKCDGWRRSSQAVKRLRRRWRQGTRRKRPSDTSASSRRLKAGKASRKVDYRREAWIAEVFYKRLDEFQSPWALTCVKYYRGQTRTSILAWTDKQAQKAARKMRKAQQLHQQEMEEEGGGPPVAVILGQFYMGESSLHAS